LKTAPQYRHSSQFGMRRTAVLPTGEAQHSAKDKKSVVCVLMGKRPYYQEGGIRVNSDRHRASWKVRTIRVSGNKAAGVFEYAKHI